MQDRCTTPVRSFVINIELTPAEDEFDRAAFRLAANAEHPMICSGQRIADGIAGFFVDR